MAVGNFLNGFSGGMEKGMGLYNAMQQAPLQRQLMQAQINQANKKAEPIDYSDAGIVDPALKGHRVPTVNILEMLTKKQQGMNGAGMTPGRKSADMAFGKDYVDWNQQGAPDVQAQIGELGGAVSRLQASSPTIDGKPNPNPSTPVSGPVRGAVPDWLRTFTNPDAIELKQNIADVTQRSLRAILGAQFTENEGKRIMANAYDDRLPPEKNVVKVQRLHDKIQQMAQAKQAMADYFEQNGTLIGYRGHQPSLNDLNEYRGGSNLGGNQSGGMDQATAQAVFADYKANPQGMMNDPEAKAYLDAAKQAYPQIGW